MSETMKPVSTQSVRTNMVEAQLRTNRINEPGLLEAFLNVPRELFVPKSLQSIAYIDGPLSLDDSRVLLEPMVQARLLVEANLRPDSQVLVIGAGTGYLAVIAASVAKSVIALEESDDLFKGLSQNIRDLHLENIQAVQGTLTEGLFAQGPYDAIIIEGGVSDIPAGIIEQLAENGRLVTIMVEPGKAGHIVVVELAGKFAAPTVRFDAEAPYLPGFAPVAKFEFA